MMPHLVVHEPKWPDHESEQVEVEVLHLGPKPEPRLREPARAQLLVGQAQNPDEADQPNDPVDDYAENSPQGGQGKAT